MYIANVHCLKWLARISHEHCVSFVNEFYNTICYMKISIFLKCPQCSPQVSPCDALFCSILPVNIVNYRSLAITLNMTPSELMRSPG
ncbi:MAG: hypothetical protein ACI8PB_003035 [Desulforhopalus sp.]|jgi:hypothetical protein